MLGLYWLINHWHRAEPTLVKMPSWTPFWPAFVLVYFGMLLTTWLLPVAIDDAGRFKKWLKAGIIGYLLVMPWWIVMPTIIMRPPAPTGFWAIAIGFLWGVDEPSNVMPCAHVVGPTVAVWYAWQVRPVWRLPLLGWLVLGICSVALTWQHRPFDILLGLAAAAIGITIAEVAANGSDERKLVPRIGADPGK